MTGNKLRSAVGKGELERRRRAAHSATKRSETPCAEPQTEAVANAMTGTNVARDERADLRSGTGAVERGTGPNRQAVERSQTVR